MWPALGAAMTVNQRLEQAEALALAGQLDEMTHPLNA